MPHICRRHQQLNPALPPPPVYMVFLRCPCGNVPCVQPILVNAHHIRALYAAGFAGVDRIPQPVLNRDLPYVLNRYAIPRYFENGEVPNDFAAAPNIADLEPDRLAYPMHPEMQPRQHRGGNIDRRNRRNRQPEISVDSDNDSEVDR